MSLAYARVRAVWIAPLAAVVVAACAQGTDALTGAQGAGGSASASSSASGHGARGGASASSGGGGAGGGASASSATGAGAGGGAQACDPGEFVTGLDTMGKLVCAP